MFRQTFRYVLAPLSTLVLMVGLTPSAAAAGPSRSAALSPAVASADGQAADATTATRAAETSAAPAEPATAPAQAETFAAGIAAGVAAALPTQAAAQPAEPAGEILDVFAGLPGPDSEQDQVAGAPGAGTSAEGSGVDPRVRAEVDDGGTVPVIIRLREQADMDSVQRQAAAAGRAAAAVTGRELQGEASPAQLSRAADDAARAARGTVVVDALKGAADATQDGVRDLLDAGQAAGQVDDVQDFWIFNGFSATVDAAALDALAAHPDVAGVNLDETIELEDPVPAETGEPLLPSWSLERVNAPDTWGEYGVRGAGVVVGIMDSGADGGHPALAESWRGNDGDTDKSWFAATGENYPEPGDGFGHGTHVAGSVLGAPPGEVTGVAPDAEWIAAKIFTDFGSTSTSIIHAGFEWMLAPAGDPAAAPDVVNNSWGSNATFSTEFWDDVEAWVAAGIVPVFSNGNNGPGIATVGSPASFPQSIGVGATDIEDRLAFFSSRGPVTWDGVEHTKPQVSAPGYQIRSAWPTHLPNAPYHTISGTSMAAPHVTGVVALMLSAAPDLTVEEVREALETTARHEPHMVDPNLYGAGVVDAFAAVTHVAHSGTVTGTVTDPAGQPVEATVEIAGRTATSTAGGYAVRVPAGTHELVVGGYGFVRQTHQVTVTVDTTVTVDVVLARAAERTLSGVVTGPDGPVSGARVVVVDAPVAPVRTGADGGFTLTVAEGSYDLRVTASGHQPAVVPVVVDGPTDLAVDLSRVAGPLPGWAQYQNNPARTGQGAEALAADTLEPAWTADAGANVVFSSPTIADGRVFVNSDAGNLSAFDLDDGAPLWVFTGSEGMRGAPAVSGGVAYTGGGVAGGIHAVDAATGELVWRLDTPGRATIYTTPVVLDGIVYATTGFTTDRSDTVFALDAATGAVIWSADIGSSVFFGPAVADGIVVAASADARRLVALDASTGAEVWSLQRDIDEFIAGPSIADGSVYVTTTVPSTGGFAPSFQGSLLAVDAATGQLRWEAPTHGDGQGSSPAVHGDLVIAGSRLLSFVGAYDRETGEPVWAYGVERSGAVSAGMLVSGDGYVFGGSQVDNRLWALDAGSGELVWEHQLDANVTSSAAYAEGRLVIADVDGNIHAFHPSGQIAGVVTGPGGPLPATVRLVGTDTQVQADGAGAYTIPGLVPGEYTIEFSHFGFGTQTRTVEVTVAQSVTVDAELSPVGNGSLTGVVRDVSGQPLAGATVTLLGTPLDPAVTGEDGGFGFGEVPAGTYRVVAAADGFAEAEQSITVTEGGTAAAEFALERFDLAVVSDHQGMIATGLEVRGWKVDRVSFAEIAGNVDNYGVVVLSGKGDDRADADLERFAQIVTDADAAGTSLVFLDQWAFSYGSIRALTLATGDPATWQENSQNQGSVWLEDVVEHPITASLPDLDRVPLLPSGADHAWFSDYSGYTLASLGTDEDGLVGGGVGYQRRTLDSNHILLPVHAPTPWSNPDLTWQPAMWDLLASAIDHAAGAAYGAVAGQVTDPDGNPLAATVEVVDGFEHTAAAADGTYRLILEPGEHTLRFRFLGSETVELPVTVVTGQTHELDVQLPDSGLGSIAGLVTDAGTLAPIAGASVTVLGTELPAASSGSDGAYQIGAVPGGTYDVEVAAAGYQPRVVQGVAVTDGAVTTLDVALARAPRVVVVGDRLSELTDFLLANSIPAREAGWEVTADLSDVDVVVLHNPASITKEEFLAALAAFDEAGVSVVFPSERVATRTRGIDLLVRHTGDPAALDGIGGFTGPSIFLHNLADHPLFAGIEADPVRLLNPSSESAVFIDYSGIPLADVALEGADPAGVGMAYNPRTPDSVHLLLGGLTSSFRNSPNGNWTEQGKQIFLNAMRWAAAPGLGGLGGTVTDLADEPIPGAVVEVAGTPWSGVTDQNGSFAIGVPPGDYTLNYSGFGYVDTARTVTVGADQRVDASAQLEVAAGVGTITGVVTSDPGDGEGTPGPLAGVHVRLLGTPLVTTTGPDGSYTLRRVEPGRYTVEMETAGHARTLSVVDVPTGAAVGHDAALRVSPLVGIIDDSDFTNSRDRGKQFLQDWGYLAEDIGFESLDRIPELDLVVANVSDFNLDPGSGGLAAFEEVVNRAEVPVLWMAQHERGSIQFLNQYHGDPAVVGQGFSDGAVTATVVQDHPLVAGLPAQFDLMVPNGRYTFFDEFGGTTVATLSTTDTGPAGDTIAFRGRTAGTVDVLLSTLNVSTWGAPSTRQSPALNWTPEAERVYVNALQWALGAQGLGAEVLGVVTSDRFGAIPSQVRVVESGRTYQGRAGDGTFLVPLQPGTWTLEVSSFGHEPATVPVTVVAGQALTQPITLTSHPTGTVSGTVTGPDGAGVPGAQVTLLDTPLGATAGGSGGYTVADVPAGDWTIRVTADGFRAAELPVSVVAGQATPVDVQLQASASVALVDTTGSGTQGTALANLIRDEGYAVEMFARSATGMTDLAARVDEFDLVIFNVEPLSTGRTQYRAAMDAANAAGVSTIFGSQFGGTAIRELSDYRGDPQEVDWGFVPPGIDYVPHVPHPIFAGFPVGEPIELITSNLSNFNQQWSSHSGWSGETLANVHARHDGGVPGADLGQAVGYKFTSPSSVEVLLGSLTANTNGFPGVRWTGNAEKIYLNAVAWAIDARQAELVGVVTGGGQPLAGATVTAVEAGATAVTGPDGSYALGLGGGTYTIRVSAFGFETAEQTVEVPATGSVTHDVDLVPLPRGSVSGTVRSATGEPVAGATITGTGILDWTATTGEDGSYTAGDLLEGDYQVTVTADGFLPAGATVTITAATPATLDVTLRPTDVGVLGDVGGSLTGYLREADVPAAELEWDADLDLSGYDVVVVNGGSPDADTFTAVLEAADEAQVSLVFGGTWAVDRGGIRLLERYTDRVVVGTQGYGDGPVQLTGFDPAHPLTTGLPDPATLIVDGGYYSVIEDYVGEPLADLHVTRDGGEPVTGMAAGWAWRTADSVEILLSASAVTEAVGPGLGWTPEGGQLLVNAIEWARDPALVPPAAPTLAADAPAVVTGAVTVRGQAEWPFPVTVLRDGMPVVTVDPAPDGTWSAEVPLEVGDNVLTALASNARGDSPASAPVTVASWVPVWTLAGTGPVRTVILELQGVHPWPPAADKAELVVRDAGDDEVVREEMVWIAIGYVHVLRDLDRGEYTLSAELTVDGHLLVVDGPGFRR
jgi:outer membrane protein assembly factor BamB/subtilisin family serine protease